MSPRIRLRLKNLLYVALVFFGVFVCSVVVSATSQDIFTGSGRVVVHDATVLAPMGNAKHVGVVDSSVNDDGETAIPYTFTDFWSTKNWGTWLIKRQVFRQNWKVNGIWGTWNNGTRVKYGYWVGALSGAINEIQGLALFQKIKYHEAAHTICRSLTCVENLQRDSDRLPIYKLSLPRANVHPRSLLHLHGIATDRGLIGHLSESSVELPFTLRKLLFSSEPRVSFILLDEQGRSVRRILSYIYLPDAYPRTYQAQENDGNLCVKHSPLKRALLFLIFSILYLCSCAVCLLALHWPREDGNPPFIVRWGIFTIFALIGVFSDS